VIRFRNYVEHDDVFEELKEKEILKVYSNNNLLIDMAPKRKGKMIKGSSSGPLLPPATVKELSRRISKIALASDLDELPLALR
ncbi:hypothetical protein LINPERPRIM_LOCUS35997, partial [Linum perenne]